MTTQERLYSMSVAKVYPLYLAKAAKKGRTQEEVDAVFRWQTGYTQKALEKHLRQDTSFEIFFVKAPKPHPLRKEVKGTICGVRVETIEDPVIREIRILDKLIDDLAKGKALEVLLKKA